MAYKQKVLFAVRSGDVRTVDVTLLPCGTRVGELPRTQTLADHPDLFKIRPTQPTVSGLSGMLMGDQTGFAGV